MDISTAELNLSSQNGTPRTLIRSRSRTVTSRTPQKVLPLTPTKLLMESVADLYVHFFLKFFFVEKIRVQNSVEKRPFY
jgi:hypothetical protein